MTNFERLKSMSIDELTEFLDANGHHDAVWWKWFEEEYCTKCETEKVYTNDEDGKSMKVMHECTYCEVYGNCRFFLEMDNTPDSKETIKLWLNEESEEGEEK